MADRLPDSQDVPIHRTEDFVSRYSNNVRFESYGTDLRVLFGSSDMGSGKEEVQQHTAITLSWSQVKVFIYYLQMQLIAYEAQTGRPVTIHPVTLPKPFPNDVPEEARNIPHAEEVLQTVRDLYRQSFPAT